MKTKLFRLLPALLAVSALCGIVTRPAAQAQPTLDFGDAPPPYPTLVNNNGARHAAIATIRLGAAIDAELDGQPNSTATGDDLNPATSDDEDGVTLPAFVFLGQVATIQVQASVPGFLNAWIDFNGDGDWADPGEQIYVNNNLAAGFNTRSFNVPATARIGTTFSRFRFTTNAITGLSFIGLVNNGEVEDHLVRIGSLDFGDAPTNNYPTLLSQDGARHLADPTFCLGSIIDAEADGQPSADSSGDDATPATADDEDGVVFLDPLIPSNLVRVRVTATIPAGQNGRLDAWVDFNADGDWLDSGEQVLLSALVTGGTNLFTFDVPPTAASGPTFSRFRLSRQGGLRPSSLAQDGEVEDYQVQIGAMDFGDAPANNFPTTLAANGARHLIDFSFMLGTKIDPEPDGQPNPIATGDDINPSTSDDEDGVVFVGPLTPGQIATVQVTCTMSVGQGRLDAWMDFNGDRDWSAANEKIFNSVLVNNGVNTLTFPIPATAPVGATFARFRLSREGGLKFDGPASDGEVEDYQATLTAAALDFGDAPTNNYPTLLSQDGARHTVVANFCLGTKVDTEPDGQPNPGATGDDINPSSSDDEDGITFTSPLSSGQVATVDVFVTSAAGQSARLDAWVDFNADGDWADAGEQIFDTLLVVPGVNSLSFAVPASAKPGTTFSRFRLSRQGGLRYAGFGSDGEVEDYRVSIQEGMDFGDAPETTAAISYPTTLARNGARHVIVQGFHMGELEDPEPNGQPTPSADGDDINPSGFPSDEDGVTGSGPLVQGHNYTVHVLAVGAALSPAYVNAWVDFNGDGDWADPGEQILAGVPVTDGDNPLTFAVPATAKTGTTFARFRYSHQKDLPFDGPAPDGEVEDYEVPIINDRDRCDLSCEGTDFWLTFPGNYAPDPDNRVRPSLCIVGGAGVTGTVAIPGLGFTTNFTIPAALSVSVPLPSAADLGDLNDSVTNKGIHVTSSAEVAIYAISKVKYTSDSYLALNTSLLGTEYIVLGWGNVHSNVPPLNGSQFAIVATESNTAVTITPSYLTGGHPKGVPFNLILHAGDTYQLRNTNDTPADLTGTVITSDKPIAVFGSHQCANVPSTNEWFCDYLVEQLPSVNTWGINFLTAPLATRSGDTFRCLASENNTTLSINGVPFALVDRGEFRQFTLVGGARISADKPVLLAQYANSADFDPPPGSFNHGDPFMSIVQATRHYESSYVVCSFTNGFGPNYLNIIAPAGVVGTVTLNGVLVGGGAFTPIAGSGFSYARVTVTSARNTVAGAAPLGLSAYGWAEYESYGHPACFHVGDVQPPTMTCNATNVTVTLGGGSAFNCFAQVPDFRQFVTADDNCSGRQGVTISQTPDPGTPLGPGVHTITLTARDTSGNKATCTVTFTVIDPSPVFINCPSNITAFCTSSAGARVHFSATARSTCDTNVPVVCTPASDSVFPVGKTTVVCQATSLAGQTASCTFQVEVRCGGGLTLSVSNNTLTVTWSGSPGTLQKASTLGGRWSVVTNGVNSYTAPVTGTQAFFRVQY